MEMPCAGHANYDRYRQLHALARLDWGTRMVELCSAVALRVSQARTRKDPLSLLETLPSSEESIILSLRT